VVGKAQLAAMRLEVQHPITLGPFPYRIRMVCGHIEIRILNLKTIGRMYDDNLIINAGCGMCAECYQLLACEVDAKTIRPRLSGGSIRPCLMNGTDLRGLITFRRACQVQGQARVTDLVQAKVHGDAWKWLHISA
jgi:hypothetical protein